MSKITNDREVYWVIMHIYDGLIDKICREYSISWRRPEWRRLISVNNSIYQITERLLLERDYE